LAVIECRQQKYISPLSSLLFFSLQCLFSSFSSDNHAMQGECGNARWRERRNRMQFSKDGMYTGTKMSNAWDEGDVKCVEDGGGGL